MSIDRVTIVGAGLAGTELALGLAERGVAVRLIDQKPETRSPAHQSSEYAELVCSNSLRAAALGNAVGLLKEEMRLLGSKVMRAALLTRVAAGGALAVDRQRFSELLGNWLRTTPLIELETRSVQRLPEERPLVIATGPLTEGALSESLTELLGEDALAYYDAIAPVVTAESVDREHSFFLSRYGRGETEAELRAYLNCPLDREEYQAFVAGLRNAELVPPRAFEEPRFFEGCLPIEVMAARGERTLAFGPMKPVGLTDPRTGRRPYAVLQLRSENEAKTAFNLVGMQTRMKIPEQDRVFRLIPALRQAVFERYGSVHRNTYLDAPRLLDGMLQSRAHRGLFFVGQLCGVEGYVESAASALVAVGFVHDHLRGVPLELPPPQTALGSLMRHLTRTDLPFTPSNITYSHFPPLPPPASKKRSREERGQLMAERAFGALAPWALAKYGVRIRSNTVDGVGSPEVADDCVGEVPEAMRDGDPRAIPSEPTLRH